MVDLGDAVDMVVVKKEEKERGSELRPMAPMRSHLFYISPVID